MDVITVCFILQTYLIVILLTTCVTPVFLLEARLNHGVLFRPAGKMSLNTQKWFYTFHFHLPSLPTHRLPLLVCLPDSPPICQQHNILLSGLNLKCRLMKLMITNTKMAAKQLLGTSLSPDLPAYRPRRTTNLLFPLSDPPSLLQQDSISPSTQSRSKRALFDFVGDLASGLFGVATQGEINTLKHHINNVYEHQQQLNNLQQKQMKLICLTCSKSSPYPCPSITPPPMLLNWTMCLITWLCLLTDRRLWKYLQSILPCVKDTPS